MRAIRLECTDGDYVATVQIPPFHDDKMPQVVMWGDRCFARASIHVYRETFCVASVTASPGLDKELLADGSFAS